MYPFVDGKKYSFKVPPSNSKYVKYLEQIENEIKFETSIAYGLHPNAEIDLGNTQCQYIFETLFELIPKKENTEKKEETNTNINAEYYYNKVFFDFSLTEKLFSIPDIKERIVEKGPF